MKRKIAMTMMLALLAAMLCCGAAQAADRIVSTWAQLQSALTEGGTVSLYDDITAESGSTALSVPSGVTVVLNLDGHTLSRGLTGAAANGYVIRNEGTLTIQRGIVTGGYNTGNGGGIYNTGTLTLDDAVLSGNRGGSLAGGIYNAGTLALVDAEISGNSAGDGGGIYNVASANITISGTTSLTGSTTSEHGGGGITNYGTVASSGSLTITGNTAKGDGGGIWVGPAASISMAGTVIIRDNTGEDVDNNLFLSSGKTITITGDLGDASRIWVTCKDGAGTITSGYGTYEGTDDPAACFFSDNDNYGITLRGGEAVLGSLVST